MLRDQLRGHDLLVANLRVTDERKDHEADLVVAVPGAGIAVVEVKGGSVWHDGEHWQQTRSNGSHRRIDPVGQARDTKYAVRRYVEQDPRWRESGRSRLRWAHVVVLPGSAADGGFALPDCPRWLVADRHQLDNLAACLAEALARQETHHRRRRRRRPARRYPARPRPAS